MQLAALVDSIPVVQSTAERATKFPAPLQDLRVWNKQTHFIERFDIALGWVAEGFVGGSPTQNLGWLNVKDQPFNAQGNNVADDTTPIQNAVSLAIANGFVVYGPKGDYKITAPIQVFTFTAGAFVGFTRLTMMGERHGDVTAGTATMLVPTFNNAPAIMIQNARTVRLVDIAVLGKNDFSGSVTIGNSFSYLMTNSNYVIGGCRDSRYSPYAGIAVDPFGTSVPADGGYPGFTDHYVASAQGSSNIEFERVAITGFVAGVVLSPNGTIAQDDLVVFRNCNIGYCKAGVAIGQNQSRAVYWYGGSNAWHLYAFDGNTYGARTGYAPHIYGCNMAGKYLFNVNSSQGATLDVSGIHAEAFASIGFIGQAYSTAHMPTEFRGCEFNFYDFAGQNPDHHLVTWAPVIFTACLINPQGMTYPAPIRFWHDAHAPLVFNATHFGAAALNEMYLAPTNGSGAAGDGTSDVMFHGSVLADVTSRGNVGGKAPLSHDMLHIIGTIERAVVPLGARIKYNSAANPGDIQFVGNGQDSIGLGSPVVTLGANGSAIFTAADATILEIGDLIYCYTAVNYENYDGTITFASNQNCVGIVSNVAGTTITVTGWPQNLAAGAYALRLQWWNRFHQPSVGDTHTNTTVDNVTNPTSWKIGNRIKGAGIPAGAYITNVVGSTLTISKAATATAAGVRLFDADVYKLTGTAV